MPPRGCRSPTSEFILEAAVLQSEPGIATLTECARQGARIVEIAEAAIAVNEHGELGRFYARDHIDNLAP